MRYTSVQRFCLHDGPGIRTTLFLFGCNLRCPWCCNPENLRESAAFPVRDEEPEELARELLKDAGFFGEDGGVTFSGGEPLLQAEALVPLLAMLKGKGIHVAVETALFTDWADIERVLPYVDLFLVDAKLMNAGACRTVIGGDIDIYLNNMQLLNKLGASVILRIPWIPGYTNTLYNLDLVASLISSMSPEGVELLYGHSMGNEKRAKLQMSPFNVSRIDKREIARFQRTLTDLEVNVKIVK